MNGKQVDDHTTGNGLSFQYTACALNFSNINPSASEMISDIHKFFFLNVMKEKFKFYMDHLLSLSRQFLVKMKPSFCESLFFQVFFLVCR